MMTPRALAGVVMPAIRRTAVMMLAGLPGRPRRRVESRAMVTTTDGRHEVYLITARSADAAAALGADDGSALSAARIA